MFKKLSLLLFFHALIIVFFIGCNKDNNTEDHFPKAAYKMYINYPGDSCYRGDLNTVYHFDASSSFDKEAPRLLNISWDFTNSGNYIDYNTTKSATHKYDKIGLYFPVLKVRDTKGLVDSTRKMVVVVKDLDNEPPKAPDSRSVEVLQDSTSSGITVVFRWSCSDPEDDSLTYDLWLAERENRLTSFDKNSLTSFKPDLSSSEAIVSNLKFNQNYYWQIYVRDVAGNYTAGPIWSFTTGAPK